MSAINKALDEIKFAIPSQILEEAFKDNRMPGWNYWQARGVYKSLDERILEKVIKPKVMVDVDIKGGQTVMLPLNTITPEIFDFMTYVFNIPLELTQNRNIISVQSVSYMPPGYLSYLNSGSMNKCNSSDLAVAGRRMLDSYANLPLVSNANLELYGNNVVAIKLTSPTTQSFMLRCMVGNDEYLNNIQMRSWMVFSELCVLAVKAYIYNTLRIRTDEGYLHGGMELGAFKEIVMEYSDSRELYNTFLKEKWSPTAFMNDRTQYSKFIRTQLNPGI